MSLYGAFDQTKHLVELATPLATAAGVLSAASRRAEVLTNIAGAAMTAAQLAAVAGVTPGTVTVSKAVVVDSAGVVDNLGVTLLRSPAATVGTAGTNCVAEEHGDGLFHITKLTCTAFAVGTGGDAADLGIGAVCYTLPAGAYAWLGGSIEGIFSQASAGVITGGEVGLGTVVASGAVAVLSGTATFENIMNGQAIATYTLGTTRVTAAGQPTAPNITTVATGASPRTVFLNIAASWPNIASAEAVTFTGTVTIRWMKIA